MESMEESKEKKSNGEEEDYMGDLSQFLPPQPSNTSKFSSKKVAINMFFFCFFLEFLRRFESFAL